MPTRKPTKSTRKAAKQPSNPSGAARAGTSASVPAEAPPASKPLSKKVMDKAIAQLAEQLVPRVDQETEKARKEAIKDAKGRIDPHVRSAIVTKLNEVIYSLCAMNTLCVDALVADDGNMEDLVTVLCGNVRSTARAVDACIAKLDPMFFHDCFTGSFAETLA